MGDSVDAALSGKPGRRNDVEVLPVYSCENNT